MYVLDPAFVDVIMRSEDCSSDKFHFFLACLLCCGLCTQIKEVGGKVEMAVKLCGCNLVLAPIPKKCW
jgi:hypothetical protein